MWAFRCSLRQNFGTEMAQQISAKNTWPWLSQWWLGKFLGQQSDPGILSKEIIITKGSSLSSPLFVILKQRMYLTYQLSAQQIPDQQLVVICYVLSWNIAGAKRRSSVNGRFGNLLKLAGCFCCWHHAAKATCLATVSRFMDGFSE